MRLGVVMLVCFACGDNLVPAQDAAVPDAPEIDALQACAVCADVATGGTAISCTGATSCEATDRDNDGVSDAAERLGYLDFDCDGTLTAVDLALPNADPDIPNIWLEIDYFERDLPATPRTCVADADCVASATLPGERNEQCFCQLSPDSCPSGATCDPLTRRCSGGAQTGHFCTHSHKPTIAALDMVRAPFQAPGVPGPLGALSHAPIILTIEPASDRIAERRVVSFGTDPAVACPTDGVCPSGVRCAPSTMCEATCPAGAPCRTLDTGCTGTDAVHFADLKDAHLDPKRRWVYRYAIVGHFASCATSAECATCPVDPTTGSRPTIVLTGASEQPGNDLIVSVGRTYFDLATTPPLFPEIVAGLLMHELGHTLGLHHGGHSDILRSPNYISSMNPALQPVIFSALGPGQSTCPCTTGPAAVGCCPRRVDYSHQILPTLDETQLDENVSIGDGKDVTEHFCYEPNPTPPPAGTTRLRTVPVFGAVDWNCNGTIDSGPVSVDINFDNLPAGSPGTTVHTGARDWPYACPASGACDACGIPPPRSPTSGVTETTCPVDQTGVAPSVGTLPCVLGQCQRFEYRFQCRDGGRAD